MNIADRGLLELLDRRSLDEHLQNRDTLLVGVSGGADSVALIRALSIYGRPKELKLVVIHINHGLRTEAAEEAAFVEKLCSSLELKFVIRKIDLSAKPKRTSPEEFWRSQRYQVFQEMLDLHDARYVALGHTADDLAETFLYHLARGTGVSGLTFQFVKSADKLPVIRPLWKTRRRDIEKALSTSDQAWVLDSSNSNYRFSRNRIRGQVIPALEEINPAAVINIVKLAEKLLDLHSAPTETESALTGDLLDLGILKPQPPDGIRKVVRSFITQNKDILPTSRHLEQAVDLITEGASGLVALPGSLTLVVTQTYVWLYDGAEPDDLDLSTEHVRRYGGLAAKLPPHIHVHSDDPVEVLALDGQRYEIKVLNASPGLVLRNRRPGDRIGPRTLKKLLIDYQVPWYLRDYLVVAAMPDGQLGAVSTDNVDFQKWISHHARPAITLQHAIVHASA